MKYLNSIFIILFICFIGIIQATDSIDLNLNNLNYKYYIISIKDASKFSFNIQPTKQDENALRRRGIYPKFNAIDIKEIHEIINSKDCVSQLYNININNDTETSLCDLGKSKNFDKTNSYSKTVTDKIEFEKLEKALEPEESFVNEQFELLAELIIDNLETYKKDDFVTEEIHNLVRKRSKTTINDIISDKSFENILKKAYNILDVTVFYGYLSDVVYEKIKNLPNVVECIENIKVPFPTLPKRFNNKIVEDSKNEKEKEEIIEEKKEKVIYYNITDIKKDTQWSDVSVEQNASSHLSLISQSKVDFNLVNEYDNNFYYPSTAGEGVDIYILDCGLNTNHVDFDTTYRNVTCDAEVRSSTVIEFKPSSSNITNCYADRDRQYHGTAAASVAAGTVNGVAKKANIHVIAYDLFLIEYITALKYIEKKAKNPHKTIINISSGLYQYNSNFDKLINILVNKGFMIFAAAGNEITDACSTNIRYADEEGDINDMFYPSSYVDVIAVGSINNVDEDIKSDKSINIYSPAWFTNYGSCIDFFAPGYANTATISDEETDEKQNGVTFRSGTSLSTPIVAGIAAILISEHSDITFNQDIMKQMLIDLSIKDVISDLDDLNTPNRLINIGKQVVYSADNKYKGCGMASGKKSCPVGSCCSAKGYCSFKDKHCEIGCQSEFGWCSMYNHPALEKPKKESEFKDIFILNYYNDKDMCVKFVPSNDINENIIMTVCEYSNAYNINNIWNIAREGDSKIFEDFYEDTCLLLDENGIAYADSCDSGTVFKDIVTVYNKDAIQSEAFPNKCLKPVASDYNPYGITIFTERQGVRVMMSDCDYSDSSQHWRFREVPEPLNDGYFDNGYFDDGPIDDDYIDDDYINDDHIDIDEESELPSDTDVAEEDLLYNKYGQVLDLNDYVEFNIFRTIIITSSKKVWIYNEELNLCVTSLGKFRQLVSLRKCNKRNDGQLWYVPDNNKGYYVNVKNDNLSIIYTPIKILIIDGYIETITLSKKHVKNHSSVISYEDNLLKIYDEFYDEEVCLDVTEDENSEETDIYVNMVPCKKATTHWRLTTEFPSA